MTIQQQKSDKTFMALGQYLVPLTSLLPQLNFVKQLNQWWDHLLASPIYFMTSIATYYSLTASLLSLVSALLYSISIKFTLSGNRYLWMVISIVLWWVYNTKTDTDQLEDSLQQSETNSQQYWSILFLSASMLYLAVCACEGMYYIFDKINCESNSSSCHQTVSIILILLSIASFATIAHLSRNQIMATIDPDAILDSDKPNLIIKPGNLITILLVQYVILVILTLITRSNSAATFLIIILSHSIIIVRMIISQYFLKDVYANTNYSAPYKISAKFAAVIIQGIFIVIFAYSGKQWHKLSYIEQQQEKSQQITFKKIKIDNYCSVVDHFFSSAQFYYMFALLIGKQCEIQHFIVVTAAYLILRRRY